MRNDALRKALLFGLLASAAPPSEAREHAPGEHLSCLPPSAAPPFATVIWNHGLVNSRERFTQAQRGWLKLCEALAAEGYLAYVPIRPFVANLGPAEIRREADQLARVVTRVFAMPEVDRARVALMGHSRGGTLALMVAVERRDLAAVILTAPAPIPARFLDGTLERARSLRSPVLSMVEKSDEMGSVGAVREIERALARGKAGHRTIVFDRGGGHFLFLRQDYWWEDLRAFLGETLGRRPRTGG